MKRNDFSYHHQNGTSSVTKYPKPERTKIKIQVASLLMISSQLAAFIGYTKSVLKISRSSAQRFYITSL
ncbi:hypothetical protein [Pedobacter sp. V48]|uniref:hypothetical protein n=1 Tax=Pedobacter sp. V48 TaxID=509635 RepID=UPI00126823D5|nr:hypothetical protein [Pedobacter sp. V48]